MTQKPRDLILKRAIGCRLAQLVDQHLAMSWDDLAEKLGYTTSSTLRQARNGTTLVSTEKLARLARVTSKDGHKRVSVDWLLTGSGHPLINVNQGNTKALYESSQLSALIANRVENSTLEVQQKIAAFLEIQNIQAYSLVRAEPPDAAG